MDNKVIRKLNKQLTDHRSAVLLSLCSLRAVTKIFPFKPETLK